MNQQLQDQGYLRVPEFISAARAAALARQLAAHHATAGDSFDAQVPGAPCSYNFLPFVRLLVERLPRVEALCGEAVLPTYAYARMYRHGATLAPHTDRPACEISLSLHLRGDRPWDFWLRNFGSAPVAIGLQPGDALLYLGCQTEHWREAFDGEDCVQVFLHYVLAHGSFAHLFFDREKTA